MLLISQNMIINSFESCQEAGDDTGNLSSEQGFS